MKLSTPYILCTARNQRGGAMVIVLGVLAALVALIIAGIMIVIGANNTANSFEQQIKAQREANENSLATYGQKIQEAVQVPALMREDLMKAARAAMEGRYGADGSKAVVQVLREQNPNLDPSLYTRLTQIIESGRDEFKTRQDRLVDIKRAYTTALGSLPQGAIMRFVGFPRINLDDYKIVSTERAQDAFKKGVEAPIQLRPAQ